MPNRPHADADPHLALRARRLAEIAGMTAFVLSIGMLVYIFQGGWRVVGALGGGVAMMLACLWLSHVGRTAMASKILLASLLATVSGVMWIAEGLHDVTLLAYPVLLIMAGLLVERRYYYSMLAVMLSYLAFLTFATDVWNWRVDTQLSTGFGLLRDVVLIVSLSGFTVWVIISDMHGVLGKLQEQIDKFHESQKHLTYLSQHDLLTALPNRSLGRDRIEQAIHHASRNKLRVALLFVDLDNFKAINDSLGHHVGDDFLKEVAAKLTLSVRKTDIVSRHGGDEFVIGLTEVSEIQDVSNAAGTILDRLTRPYMAKETEISSSCSIGIALYPDDGEDYDALLRQSDIAMYQAKEAGRNAFRFFDEDMNVNIKENLLLVSSLRSALSRREFVLHYQPVVDLESGRLLGAEALVRWNHPDKGLVPPVQFIPAAEKSGLIVELGEWVLGEACRQLVAWQAMGCGDFVMAVNLSPVQFRRGDIDVVVENALRRSGVNPQSLELEITESTLIQDTEKFIVSLQKLKSLGVKISIDDFGTGYSNLSYLQRFAVDKLKIDQSFVMRLRNGPQERAIVSAIIQMAKSLNLGTTAEGIEEDAVRHELLSLGCAVGQGYFFARPQPAAEFAKLIPRKEVLIDV